MQQREDDLSVPREIDFYFAFPAKNQADSFADQEQLTIGLPAEASRYEERDMWQVRVTKHMVPTHDGISTLENSLSEIAMLYDGEADGWGCFNVSKRKRRK
jgi:hypothetical protein